MTVKSCEKLEKSRVALTIEVGAEEFEAAVNKAYLKMRGKMNIPGFRPGKAPRKMIESMYGAEVFYEEAVNAILPDAYESAVDEQKLEVVGYPQVEIENVGKEGATFKCTVAVYPEVELGQYKGLEAVKAEVKVMAADVNARLKEMADRNSRLVAVERAVKKGDTANIDFEGFDQGVAFEGGKGEAFDLEIGSGSFVPGFEDQLIGMKAGEEKKDVEVSFPSENAPDALKGKKAAYELKVTMFRKRILPDDAGLVESAKAESMEKLRSDIRERLEKQAAEAEVERRRNQAIELLLKKVDFDVPPSLVQRQAEAYLGQLAQQMQYAGVTGEYIEQNREKILKDAQEHAERQVRLSYMLLDIADAEKIEVDEKDENKKDQARAEKTLEFILGEAKK